MFAKFESAFLENNLRSLKPAVGNTVLDRLINRYGGFTFGSGIYRIFTRNQAKLLQPDIESAFPQARDNLEPFAADWLGRVFALQKDKQNVVLAEPGTAELLEIPVSVADFHECELIEHSDAALAESFFKNWRNTGGAAPKSDQCVGYKVPLFLGGQDVVDNLEMIDMEVYWTVISGIITNLRNP